jgi:tetrahydromethanopterin S-methyltransferase subunit B
MKKITRDDISELAKHNPVVYSVLKLNYMGEISFEDAMMLAVSLLVEQVDELSTKLHDSIINSPNPSWKIE